MAIRLNNLAGLYQATNRLEEAEVLYRRALEIDEAGYGPDHPEMGIRLWSLADLLHADDRRPEAKSLLRRAAKILETSLGPEHTDTRGCRQFLNQLLVEARLAANIKMLLGSSTSAP